jgi:hypothetical protein
MNAPLPSIVSELIDASRHGFQVLSPAKHGDSYALRHGLPLCVGDAELRQAHVARVLRGLAQLLELDGAFQRAGLAHVWLKGPAFAQWVYADPGARRFSDLDLLVRPADRDAALHHLEALGFERRIPSRPGEVIYASIGAWPLVRQGSLGIDLHWQLAGRRFPRVLTADDVIEGAQCIAVAGRQVPVPASDHAAVMHLSHSAKHLWYALEHTLSAARLMQRRDIDWARVRRLLSAAGSLRAGAAGLQLATELYEVPVPGPFAADVTLKDVVDLCEAARTSLSLPPGAFPDRRLDRRLQLLCFDRRIDRWEYDVRRVMEPTQADWEWCPVPARLSAAYWPIRLVRLAAMGLGWSDGAPRKRDA